MAMALQSSTDNIPTLNIVIQIVGTLGDIKPFLAYARELASVRHRVRVATHKTFQKLVIDNELEFFPLAGDPEQLMKYMVENGGIYPSVSSFMKGDVSKNENTVHEILRTTWYACIADDEKTGLPFTADVIIANPPSFGHIHCAEKLGIPLHIVFTMPWTATRKFPHPFKQSQRVGTSSSRSNRGTYAAIEQITWIGISRVVNHFRKNVLELSPLEDDQALSMMKDVPHTYCWSPSLVPKPHDWGPHIDVCGYFFHSSASNYHPSRALLHFLEGSSRPLYIGFGSIIGHDRSRLFEIVRDALEETKRRAVVCKKLTAGYDPLPLCMFPIDNCPHDWLFQHVDGVCHHGGAGTTATGLRAGLPTIVTAFFGDQFFWGNVVQDMGAGPPPLSGRNLRKRDLIKAIKFITNNQEVRENARRISEQIQAEQGCKAAIHSFHRQLPVDKMHSDLESTYAACYYIARYNIRISWPVAQVLLVAKKITQSQLKPWSTREWNFANSESHPKSSHFRIPTEEIPYSREQRLQIVNNFDLIINRARE
ncbi:unnamed protein product [Adineta steineri]|uniref:Glycosyltransferase family 28 N-terminal domain-containing protein n=1 Tax=Adineta steineri TaxID=433720 RepID=A0A819YSV1_9BILA|nr:unnamed protein product [Adineta steineri]CAF4153814.1 unnamed protein product [Adineta steineri]